MLCLCQGFDCDEINESLSLHREITRCIHSLQINKIFFRGIELCQKRYFTSLSQCRFQIATVVTSFFQTLISIFIELFLSFKLPIRSVGLMAHGFHRYWRKQEFLSICPTIYEAICHYWFFFSPNIWIHQVTKIRIKRLPVQSVDDYNPIYTQGSFVRGFLAYIHNASKIDIAAPWLAETHLPHFIINWC